MKYRDEARSISKEIAFFLFVLFASSTTIGQPTPFADGTTSEPLSSGNVIVSMSALDYMEVFNTLVIEDSEIDWQEVLRPVSPLTTPEFASALAVIDSLRQAYDIAPDSMNCERWPAWQLGLCNLEIAAGRYSEAVDRHLCLFKEPTSCIDDQQMWWFLVEQHYYQLLMRKQYSGVAELLEPVVETFPSGPAREMRSELARLKYRLGMLEWSETIEGTLGEFSLGGIASHYRDIVTDDDDTLTYLITKETIIVCNEEIWVPWAGFTPKQDFESEYRGGDPFSVSDPVDSGKPAVFYLDDLDELIMIELVHDSKQD